MLQHDEPDEALDARSTGGQRPRITVIVPFAGSEDEALATLDGLAVLDLVDGDELIVVDNEPGGVVPERRGIRVVRDAWERSSYYARNRGAEEASNEWLLFIDADCRPSPTLLSDLLADGVPQTCGLIAGAVRSAPDQRELAARYARSRSMVSETFHVEGDGLAGGALPAGITANLLVRRAAFDDAGGFHEGVFSGADIELCWRIQQIGWGFAHQSRAVVEHVHPTSVRALLHKAQRYGAGRRWVNRRYPGWAPRQPLLRPLARCAAGSVAWALTLRFERARFKAIDALWFIAAARGFVFGDNRAITSVPDANGPGGPAYASVAFPVASDPHPQPPALVEAATRPLRVDREAARAIRPVYAEDDRPGERVQAAAWLISKRPGAVVSERGAGARLLAELAPAARRLERVGAASIGALPGGEERARLLRRLTGLDDPESGRASEH
jgi:GT2 family glycosyltransferase